MLELGDAWWLPQLANQSQYFVMTFPIHAGWSMQTAHFLFISRDWAKDQQYLSDNFTYFRSIGYPLQLLLFPEGTDLSESNKEKSQRFAKQKGLPQYDYVLHPRSKGFIHCINEMRKFEVAPKIINMSVGYVGAMPQNERDIAYGNWPTEIHFYSEQIPPTDLPSDEQDLEAWLNKTWSEKEEQLKEFYRNNRFNATYMRLSEVVKAHSEMKWILGFWVVFFGWMGYSLVTSYFYWWYLPLWTVFFLLWNALSNGTDDMVLRKYVKRSK